MRTFRLVVSALAVCVALSACGGQDGGDGTPTPTPTGAQPVTSPPSPDPTTPGMPPATGDPVDPTAPVQPPPTKRPGGPTKPPPVGGTTLTGTVTPGVEPNCLLLDGYLLIGGPRDVLSPGAKVTVTGRVQPDMLTTCQQGTPFLVEAARRA
ncbi:alanine and proline-rich secreted protein Apa [Micromonospora phytophila]|uniref:alanine and proline-rich secreted protein Apa n=1 Tax=Micromonospora phytophila TaxID=709888 RepID=UPI00202EC9C9|nr:alanine and proline-rich secreted protein Apa [Micromonospora phytophila]MCM0675374.1 alanine and proline-rich secreted protein Apa [Micromonospora phytophila]